ncbi:glycosyltransferase BC10-like isoform X1 [Vigna umbellata]|uniref:glycosyltransferase BC10-like isoform X1 n=1 Tax=Vigna umbellata TaxID=87088 RepID=UPI001F5F8A5A|nr:glycosyltransferase BC10-like isoform X1 [Vigna umbellata]
MASAARGAKRRHAISRKMLIFFSASLSCVVVLLLLSLFRFHSPKPSISVSRVFDGPPKIAFLFLVRRNLPLDFLWDAFFQNGDVSRFSIYVHSTPGFVLDESTTRSQFFYGRQISNSIQVLWGESSMIQAERLLLEAALEDPSNQRFVLLSDSCVPLYNFSYVYNYVMVSPKSFVDSFLDVKEGRYNPKMSPKIPREKWRKGSQWITVIRKHAEAIVDDDVIFSVFKKYCKRRPPIDTSKGKLNLKLQKLHNCIPDEHYVQTLLAMHGLESELERRTITYTLWNQSTTKMENKGWHPVTFGYSNAGPQRIMEIKGINHVYYETEYRIEWCRSNSTSVPCFLFARKFSQGAAMRLLSQEVVNHFEVSALLATPP